MPKPPTMEEMEATANLREYKTEYGSYLVTAEDYRLLCEDMTRFGTIAVQTTAEGDGVRGTRVDPASLHAAELSANKGVVDDR